jgi:alkyl sulfatase BDS1-like metallo-beta-lactamase superfamily hydrolase
VRKALEDYLDGASFVLDQSLRGILAGLGPDDLRHFVTFPKYLDDAPFNLQNYGEISTYSPAIFCQAIGWYDNNAANMKPISPSEEAKRLVPFMGGREKVHPGAKLTTAASPPYQQPSLCRDRPMGPAMLRRKVCRDT